MAIKQSVRRNRPVGPEDVVVAINREIIPVLEAIVLEIAQSQASIRVTGDVTLSDSYHHVFCDTDAAAITVTLPEGEQGREYRIINCGSTGNAVTVTPGTGQTLLGVTTSQLLGDGDVLIIVFDATEGWW